MAMKQSHAFETKMNSNIQLQQIKQDNQLHSNTNSNSNASTSTNSTNYRNICNFYDKIMLILKNNSSGSNTDTSGVNDEYVYVIQELWNRFNHIVLHK